MMERLAPPTTVIRRLSDRSVGLIANIDRAETITSAYRMVEGRLERDAVEWRVPNWRRRNEGSHTLQSQIDGARELLDRGGILLGAFVRRAVAGLAIVVPEFEPHMSWLAYLHVTRPSRHQGVGRALWDEAVAIAGTAGARSMYVSATPSGPTVDFYLGCGCRPVDEPHPALYELEPEDIHLVCEIGGATRSS
jgi:GNAT superfamily N-acetyltransferase